MHLKRLKVRNFKSFAGATEIPFQPGFTGVAGPNGMGKSNISDAILFVLGPTSSKALRADRLTHLFFNGGATKKPASECEVSLVFDNEDRLLPVEANEVELTRYVKLAPSDPNGYYSYFYVNGRRSTQTEIDALLSHARLSGDGYNLVQQGDVNRIVGMGPVPRRGLVERLAGISQYDDELARAETKRTDLDANLDRIATLLTEIRSRLQALEAQRLQAIQYKQIVDEKRRAEARLARAGHLLARQELTSCQQHLEKLQGDLARLRVEAAQLEGQRDKVASAIEAIEKEIAERGGPEATKFKEELDARRMAFARLDENVRGTEDDLATLTQRSQALTDQIAEDDTELAHLTAQEAKQSEVLSGIESKVRKSSEELKGATGQADHSQGKLVGTRKEILVLERQLEQRQQDWQSVVQRKEAAAAALAAAEQSLAQAEDDHRTRELELKDLELRSGPTAPEAGGGRSGPALQKELFQLRAKEKALTEEVTRLSQELLELNRRYMALDARLKARAESGGKAGALAAVDFLLSQRNLGKIPGIRGTVEELTRIDPPFQTAMTVAAGARYQALVVESDRVAEECIQLLRAERRGRATFLPLNRMLAGRPKGKSLVVAGGPGSKGFAIDLAKFDEELRPAFWYVFGETVVMEDLGAARSQMGGVRLVTLQGDLIEATGAISGGWLETGDRARGADSAVELKRLGDELRAKSAQEADARSELATVTEKVRVLADEWTKRSAQAEAHESTRQLLDKELGLARERLKEADRRTGAAETARSTAESDLKKSEAESETLTRLTTETKSSLAKLQEQYLGNLPGALSNRIRALQEALEAANDERVKASGELENTRASLQAATGALSEKRTLLVGAKKERADKERQSRSLLKSRDEAKAALDALRAVEQTQLASVQGKTEEKRALDDLRLKLVDKLARAQEAIQTRTGLVQTEEVRRAQAEAKVQEVERALQEFPEPAADEPAVPLDELKRTIQTLSAQLDSMGSVNQRAVEEYDQEKARLDEFEGEVNRLTTEKKELLALVGEVERKKHDRLVQVVISVNEGYKQIYGELSGGGEGEISLETPENPLAGGLLIKARPVGKNVQRLEQLSGGEKSLASLAFIFALQRHDPSPLYVFDEVDMSLDGVNAENVGRLLRRNAERAQFIVISLRKVTLKFAHQLFGVTMHGDGCSRVVSLKLDEIIDVDERDRPPESVTPLLAPGAA